MTTLLKLLNNPRVIFWQLLFWSAVDLIIVGTRADLSKSDWASWVQAIGSILAICVALYLAGSEQRNKRTDALTIAIVASVDMLHSTNEAQNATKKALKLLERAEVDGFSLEKMLDVSDAIAQLEWRDRSDITSILPLPKNCALHIARGQFLIVQVRSILTDLFREGHLRNLPTLREREGLKSRSLLQMAETNFGAALRILNSIAKPAEFSSGSIDD